MKKSKFLCLIAFTIMLFALPYSCSDQNNEPKQSYSDEKIEIRSGGIGESCLPDIQNCPGGIYSWNIALDLFPGCIFPVSVDYIDCSAGTTTYLYLGDFEIDYDNLYCDDYYDYIDDCIQNGTLDDCIIELNQAIWEQVTLNLLNGTNYDPFYPTTIEYYIGAYKFLCGYETLDCVEIGTICCRKVYKYVYDPVNREWVVNWEGESELIGGECPDQPSTSCPPTSLQTETCFDNCASLDFFD